MRKLEHFLSLFFLLGRFHSVVVLQLPDLSLVAVNLALQTFNLLFVVVNFLLVVLLQRSQLLLLLTPYVQMRWQVTTQERKR